MIETILFFFAVTVFLVLSPIVAHPIIAVILFGVFFFLIYKLFRLKFKFSKKIIIFTAIISLILVILLLRVFFWGCGGGTYTVPIKVNVVSLTDDAEPLDHLVILQYKGKYDGALKNLIKNPDIDIYLSGFGCLDLEDEYEASYFRKGRSPENYLRTHKLCFGSHSNLTEQKGEVIKIDKKGEYSFVREVVYYRPEQKFYNNNELQKMPRLWIDRSTNEKYFEFEEESGKVRYIPELVEEEYEIKITVPWFGKLEKGASCELM